MSPFFIVGCPRSGTTLLQQCLNRHPRVTVPAETSFLAMLRLSRSAQERHLRRINEDLQIDLPMPGRRAYRDTDATALFGEMARQCVRRQPARTITHFGEKSPEHLNHLPRIAALFPTAKILLVHRDGRDVALGLRNLPFTSRDLFVNFALWLYCCRLQRAAERRSDVPILSVRYEDLVIHPKRELRRVADFLDLPFDPALVHGTGIADGIPEWESAWKSRAADGISAAGVGAWRQRLSAEEVAVLESWGRESLRHLGYELATDGRRSLSPLFYARVACKSAHWLLTRPSFGSQKRICESRMSPSGEMHVMNASK